VEREKDCNALVFSNIISKDLSKNGLCRRKYYILRLAICLNLIKIILNMAKKDGKKRHFMIKYNIVS
jgi:hypothetical protein